jgi:hypothetical protein
LILLAASFAAGLPIYTAWRPCGEATSNLCVAAFNGLSVLGWAFPFGFAFLTLMMAPVDPRLFIVVNAALAFGLAALAWRLLPPRLTIRRFLLLIAAWVTLSLVSFPLGVEVMDRIGTYRFETQPHARILQPSTPVAA